MGGLGGVVGVEELRVGEGSAGGGGDYCCAVCFEEIDVTGSQHLVSERLIISGREKEGEGSQILHMSVV